MNDLRHYLDTIGDGANTDWTVNNKPSGYEAVLRGTSDNYYISSSTLGHVSDFDCGDGPSPFLGFVAGVTLHYRYRATDLTGVPDFAVGLFRAGAAIASTSVTPSLTWQDGAFRLGVDPVSGVRFTPTEVADLGIGVDVTTAPTAGTIQISQLWLEVEWVDAPDFYDPVAMAALPSAVLGDMAWSTAGTQGAAIFGGELLRLTDSSAVDYREYYRTILSYDYRTNTEVCTRCQITSATLGFVYNIATIDESTHNIKLCAFRGIAGLSVGLATAGANLDDQTAYLDSAYLDWTASHHYRVVVDRDPDMSSSNNVRVYVDYASTPLLDVRYTEFLPDAGLTRIWFGTGNAAYQTAQSVVDVAYFSWNHYRRTGSGWRYWLAEDIGDNKVLINFTDASRVPLVSIPPINITAGQSNSCAQLVSDTVTDTCSLRTYVSVPDAAGTYDLTLDYRFDIAVVTGALTVQRTSDHYYWNEAGGAWQAAAVATTIPNAVARTRTPLMTAIQTATPDTFIIKIAIDNGMALAHNLYVYKVDLRD